MSESTDRDAALRRLLVAEVTTTRLRRRTPWIPIIGSVALVAALAGFAVGVGALRASEEPAPVAHTPRPDVPTPAFVYDDALVLDAPFAVEASGSLIFEAGAAPNRATALAVAVYCLEAARIDITLDGAWQSSAGCDSARGGSGGYQSFEANGPNILQFTSNGGRFAVWIAWVDRPADPAPSPEQAAALADDVVTEDEYRAAFARYSSCMEEGGHPVLGTLQDGPVISYSNSAEAQQSGLEHRCYLLEFEQVDMTWQLSQEE